MLLGLRCLTFGIVMALHGFNLAKITIMVVYAYEYRSMRKWVWIVGFMLCSCTINGFGLLDVRECLVSRKRGSGRANAITTSRLPKWLLHQFPSSL